MRWRYFLSVRQGGIMSQCAIFVMNRSRISVPGRRGEPSVVRVAQLPEQDDTGGQELR